MSTQVLTLVRHPGKEPDKAYLEHVLKDYQTATGMAVAKNGSLSCESFREGATADAVLEACKEFKDHPILMTFVQSDKIMDEDIPPMLILGEDDNPTLVGALEGDFTKYKQEQGGHTDAFYCFFKYLRPKLKKLEMQCGNDIAKVLAELKDPLVQQEMTGIISGTGSITLLSKTGQFRTFANQPMQMGFDWGWTSNLAGYKAAPKQEAAAPVKKVFGMFKKKVEATAPEPAKEEPKKVEEPITAPAQVPETAPVKVPDGPRELVANDPKNPILLVKAPATLDSKNKRKEFYLAWLPFLPNGFKDSPQVQINLENLRQAVTLGSLPAGITLKPAEGKSATAIPKTRDQEVARQHVSPTTDKVETKPEAAADDQVLAAQEKIDLDVFMRKHEVGKTFKDNNQPLNIDPAEIQKLEERIVKATSQGGVSGGLKAISLAIPQLLLSKAKDGTDAVDELIYGHTKWIKNLLCEYAWNHLQAVSEAESKGHQEGAVEQAPVKKSFGTRKAS